MKAPYIGQMDALRSVPVVALVLLTLGAVPLRTAHGQDSLDLSQAIMRARASGPLRRMTEARRQVGLGQVAEATQWANPSLEWRRENLGSPLLPDIFATAYIPFDVSGRRLALRQAATAGRQRVTADASADQRDGELTVARAWLRAAGAHGALDVVAQQYDALREIARVDAERLREGLVSEAVGLRTSLEADRSRVALVAARHEARQARVELARLLGVDEPSLPGVASLTPPALPSAPDSAAATASAMAHRVEVQAREAAVEEAQRRVAAERRGVLGEVQLQGGTKETGGFMTGQLGVAMPLPFFNRNTGARQRAAGMLNEARVMRDDVRLSVRGGVMSALAHYENVRRAASDAATFSVRGHEVARIARLSYREGHITLTELLDAERASADAMQAQLRWSADAWLARLELERAIGARLSADSPLDLPLLVPTSSGR